MTTQTGFSLAAAIFAAASAANTYATDEAANEQIQSLRNHPERPMMKCIFDVLSPHDADGKIEATIRSVMHDGKNRLSYELTAETTGNIPKENVQRITARNNLNTGSPERLTLSTAAATREEKVSNRTIVGLTTSYNIRTQQEEAATTTMFGDEITGQYMRIALDQAMGDILPKIAECEQEHSLS